MAADDTTRDTTGNTSPHRMRDGGRRHDAKDTNDATTAATTTATTAGTTAGGAGASGGEAAGVLPVAVVQDLIRVVNTARHEEWMGQVRRIGGCAHPLHLTGTARTVERATGTVVREFSTVGLPGMRLLIRCGNRRAAVCPACAAVYHNDTFHLVRAGLLGGKGVPVSVDTHPRVFVTLTAPGFGPVHTTRTTTTGAPAPCRPGRTGVCSHGAAAGCWARHGEDDPVLGAPLCPECYDYPGAVIWQASMGALWRRFITYLPRHLARVVGMSGAELAAAVRVSFVKVVEFQRRGLVHVHAVIRADAAPAPGEEDRPDLVRPAPAWVSAARLEQAVRSAVPAVRLALDGGPAGARILGWGHQVDVQDITTPNPVPDPIRDPVRNSGGEADGEGDVDAWGATGRNVALYVAKYATKGTEITGWTGRSLADTPRAEHAHRMITTAVGLSEVPELAGLKLGRWAKNLAFRGHVSSKSRCYSTTLTALREARTAYTRGQDGDPGADESGLRREGTWRIVGHGYTPGQALLAGEVARDAAVNKVAAREGVDRVRPPATGERDRAADDGATDDGAADDGATDDGATDDGRLW